MNTYSIQKVTKQKLTWTALSILSYIGSALSFYILLINVVSTPYIVFAPSGLLVAGLFFQYKKEKCQSISKIYGLTHKTHKVRLDPTHKKNKLAQADSVLRTRLELRIYMVLLVTGIIAPLELILLLGRLHRSEMDGISDSIGVITIATVLLILGILQRDSIQKDLSMR